MACKCFQQLVPSQVVPNEFSGEPTVYGSWVSRDPAHLLLSQSVRQRVDVVSDSVVDKLVLQLSLDHAGPLGADNLYCLLDVNFTVDTCSTAPGNHVISNTRWPEPRTVGPRNYATITGSSISHTEEQTCRKRQKEQNLSRFALLVNTSCCVI